MIPSSVPRILSSRKTMETFAGEARLKRLSPGPLSIPSGQLVIFDPQFGPRNPPLKPTLPTQLPIHILLAQYPDDDERIAAVWIELASTPPKRWTAALPDSVHVESGVVCLADAKAVEPLRRDEKQRIRVQSHVESATDQNYKDTRSWGFITTQSLPPLFFCSSGFGDGIYGHYLGYDEKGALAHVLTDFGLLLTEPEIEAMNDEAM